MPNSKGDWNRSWLSPETTWSWAILIFALGFAGSFRSETYSEIPGLWNLQDPTCCISHCIAFAVIRYQQWDDDALPWTLFCHFHQNKHHQTRIIHSFTWLAILFCSHFIQDVNEHTGPCSTGKLYHVRTRPLSVILAMYVSWPLSPQCLSAFIHVNDFSSKHPWVRFMV